MYNFEIILLTFLGLCLGSFTTLLIHRLHHDEKGIIVGRSRCPHCQTTLKWYNLFPVFSWLFQRGKCNYCHTKISPIYPLIELSFGVTFFLIAQKFLPEIITLPLLIASFLALILFWYDARYFQVDTRIVWPAIGGALLWAFFREESIQSYLLGGSIGYIFYAAQYYLSKGKWVGSGDQLLGLYMGLLLGWQQTLGALFLAYILGSIVAIPLLIAKKAHPKTMLPMGAFLMPALLLMLYCGQDIVDLYVQWVFGGM